MGELWVITASERTAAWARTVCDAAGKKGTRIRLEPIVLLVGREEVAALLDAGRPSLAFFAAWAMQGRHGLEAEQVVERALDITDELPDEALRRQQERDIMGVLNRRLVDKLKETIMDAKRSMESRWVREMRHELFADEMVEVRAEGEAAGEVRGKGEGKREAIELGEVLTGEDGSALGPGDREASPFQHQDQRWIAASGKAASVQELLREAPKKNGARNGAAKHRAARPG